MQGTELRINLGQTSSVSQAIRRTPSICPSDSDSYFLWLRRSYLAKTDCLPQTELTEM